MGNEEIKYFKVLGEGLRTRNGYQWTPGEWNEESQAVIGEVCGVGLHVFKDRPNWCYTRYLPDHTYRVLDTEGLCGEDKEKARFARVKLASLPMTLEEILGDKRDGMRGADLSGADLYGANLYGAHGCKGKKELSEKQKNEAHC